MAVLRLGGPGLPRSQVLGIVVGRRRLKTAAAFRGLPSCSLGDLPTLVGRTAYCVQYLVASIDYRLEYVCIVLLLGMYTM